MDDKFILTEEAFEESKELALKTVRLFRDEGAHPLIGLEALLIALEATIKCTSIRESETLVAVTIMSLKKLLDDEGGQ